jgi:hypothetical protein
MAGSPDHSYGPAADVDGEAQRQSGEEKARKARAPHPGRPGQLEGTATMSYPLLDAFLTRPWFSPRPLDLPAAWIIMDIFRRDLSGWSKTGWLPCPQIPASPRRRPVEGCRHRQL